jgi:hypothetical protein
MMDESLFALNVYCGNCAVYRKGGCLGCRAMGEKREKEGRVFCDIFLCTRDRGFVTCSDCSSYPCEKHDKGIFAKSYIGWVREKLGGVREKLGEL